MPLTLPQLERHLSDADTLLNEEVVDAVMGLVPTVPYDPGIPARLLTVLLARASRPKEHKGRALFINADRAFAESTP
jgi:hypothetical protein